MVRVGIIGVGRQGSKYVRMFFEGKIKNAELVALCDINEERFMELDSNGRCYHFIDYRLMLTGKYVDAIIIDTPHYLHPIISMVAVKNGIHVLSDKPLGIDAYTVKKIEDMLKKNEVTFGVLFNQRMLPIYKRIKELLERNELGKLKRCVWEITDWYRPQKYYDIGEWRSSWKGEGGGVLVNQCVHNIDMICHLFGTPIQVNASIGYGVYHDTEIDDSVVANLLYPDGFVCSLISSTGETPGTNRLEISGTRGKIVFEKFDELEFYINDVDEHVFSITVDSPRYSLKFGKPTYKKKTERVETNVNAHLLCIQNYINSIINHQTPSASYYDGLACVETINAIYYSDWKGEKVDFPVDSNEFKKLLEEKCNNQ